MVGLAEKEDVPAVVPLQFHLVILTFHLITQFTSTNSMFSLPTEMTIAAALNIFYN